MQKKIIIGTIAALLLLAILVGYWASTAFTSGNHQKKEVVVSKETTSLTPTTSTEPTKPVQGMTKGFIFRIVLYFGLVIVGILVWEKYGLGVHWKAYWLNNPFMQAIVYAAMLNFVIYKFFPDFWWENLCSWSAVLFYSMIALSLSVKNKIGKIVAAMLLLTFIVHIGGWNVEAKIDQAVKIIHGEDEGSTSTHAATRPGNFLDVKIEKTPCLEHDGLEGLDSDKIRKDLREYPALLAIACRESGLNHMDPENPSKVFSGKQDPRDKGFLQINTHYHKPETVQKVAGCKNLEDYGCSLSYGIKLYEADGLNAWFPYGTSNERGRNYKPLTVFVIAKDGFGPRINIPRLTNTYRFDHQGKTVVVEAEDQNGIKKEYTLVDDDKTAPVNIGTDIRWVRFKRGPNEIENVKVSITYTFQVP